MEFLFRAVADGTRRRILQVLSMQELSVSEVVDVLRLPQSTVSRHLKTLRDAGLLVDRRLGATVLYSARPIVLNAADSQRPEAAAAASPGIARRTASNGRRIAELRDHLLEWAGHEPLDAHTAERLDRVVRRRQASGDFFERVGTRWDQLRVDAFGEAFQLEALTALLPADWSVADIGTGTGYLLPLLAGRFRRVIAIDPVPAMLALARQRPGLENAPHIAFREGALDRLPVETGELDLAIASLVLHHVVAPAEALPELRRAVKPGGRLLIIEQRPHGGDEFHERMGDHWRGFEPEQLVKWLEPAGFADIQVSPLTQPRDAGRQAGEVPELYALVATAREQG